MGGAERWQEVAGGGATRAARLTVRGEQDGRAPLGEQQHDLIHRHRAVLQENEEGLRVGGAPCDHAA